VNHHFLLKMRTPPALDWVEKVPDDDPTMATFNLNCHREAYLGLFGNPDSRERIKMKLGTSPTWREIKPYIEKEKIMTRYRYFYLRQREVIFVKHPEGFPLRQIHIPSHFFVRCVRSGIDPRIYEAWRQLRDLPPTTKLMLGSAAYVKFGLGSVQIESLNAYLSLTARLTTLMTVLFALSFGAGLLIGTYVLPHVPGYCYTVLFEPSERVRIALKHGPYPFGYQLMDEIGWRMHEQFESRVKARSLWTSHIVHVPKKTQYSKDTHTIARDIYFLQCGGELPTFPFFKVLEVASKFIRLFLWMRMAVAFLRYRNVFVAASSVLTLLAAVTLKYDFEAFGVSVALMLVLNTSPLLGLVLAAVWFFTLRVLYNTAIELLRGRWKECDVPPPTIDDYPKGMASTDEPAEAFKYPDRNDCYERKLFTENELIIGEERREFTKATGLADSTSRPMANPHKLAAQLSSYHKWLATNMLRKPEYTIVLAGTFRGWGQQLTGAAIQPILSDSDAANVEAHGDRAAFGQQLVVQHLNTDCGPVGGGTIDWKPKLPVTGLGGATMWMTHCYDIPIKALLGHAAVNNTRTVYVSMHGSPALFNQETGLLPWSRQFWRHVGNDTYWWWENTSGRRWKHNRRIHFEHFFTDYVQVMSKVWYVSDLYRETLDLYLIRWTRTTSKPQRTFERQISLTAPHSLCVVPIFNPHKGGLFIEGLDRIYTNKQMEEYVHNAKNEKEMAFQLRAVVDNFARNRDLFIPHCPTDCIANLWNAEEMRRSLLFHATRKDAPPTWKGIFGLEADNNFASRIGKTVYEWFVYQPPTVYRADTICHDGPYVGNVTIEPVVKRNLYMDELGKESPFGFYSQLDMNRKPPYAIVELRGRGESLSEQLFSVLFGRLTFDREIIPCGTIAWGGSSFNKGAGQLLKCEAEYLLDTFNLVFVIKKPDGYVWCSGAGNVSCPAVVLIDTTTIPIVVSRVHYPTHSTEEVRQTYGYRTGDFERECGWLDNNDTNREYVASDQQEAEFELMYKQELYKFARTRKGREEMQEMLAEYNANPPRFLPLDIENADAHASIPLLEQPPHVGKFYDRKHMIEGSLYPPPHHFAMEGIEKMRKLRAPNIGE
jgi:hypothetical protein